MPKLLITVVQLLVLLALPSMALAQQQLVSDPEIYEKDHFREQCQTATFGPDFIRRFDINNDGITDLVANHAELNCNGVKGPHCTADGCPHNFYIQAKEGGYILIATAQIYSYDFVKYFGNMVFMLKMHPRFCNRTDARPCVMRVRVRGGRFVTISRK